VFRVVSGGKSRERGVNACFGPYVMSGRVQVYNDVV
jgi:hypothetical protein